MLSDHEFSVCGLKGKVAIKSASFGMKQNAPSAFYHVSVSHSQVFDIQRSQLHSGGLPLPSPLRCILFLPLCSLTISVTFRLLLLLLLLLSLI